MSDDVTMAAMTPVAEIAIPHLVEDLESAIEAAAEPMTRRAVPQHLLAKATISDLLSMACVEWAAIVASWAVMAFSPWPLQVLAMLVSVNPMSHAEYRLAQMCNRVEGGRLVVLRLVTGALYRVDMAFGAGGGIIVSTDDGRFEASEDVASHVRIFVPGAKDGRIVLAPGKAQDAFRTKGLGAEFFGTR